MNDSDAALMKTFEGQLGFWLGSFMIPMALAYILLRIAGSPKRKRSSAVVLRVIAILLVAILALAAGVTQINPGSALAFFLTVAWAGIQQFKEPAQQAVASDRADTPRSG